MKLFFNSEEEKLKQLEKNVSQLAEESCFAAEENDKQAVRNSITNSYICANNFNLFKFYLSQWKKPKNLIRKKGY